MDTHVLLALFHIFLVAPLFLFVALSRSETPLSLYKVLLFLGVIIFFYHGYKAILRHRSGSSMMWINLIHVFYIAPLLIFVGYNEKETPRYGYELMALVGFAALGYHMYSLVTSINLLKAD